VREQPALLCIDNFNAVFSEQRAARVGSTRSTG
jgi:hypothetical protein